MRVQSSEVYRDQRRAIVAILSRLVSLSSTQSSSTISFGTRDSQRIFFILFLSARAKSACWSFKNSFFRPFTRQPPKWMPHYCLPWKICSSKRTKRICCKRAAQRLERHHCRYLHAARPFRISVINSIYRQHRWHRTPAKRTIITVRLPISWTHWISIHLRIYCERFVPALFFSVHVCLSESECAIWIEISCVWNQIECIWLQYVPECWCTWENNGAERRWGGCDFVQEHLPNCTKSTMTIIRFAFGYTFELPFEVTPLVNVMHTLRETWHKLSYTLKTTLYCTNQLYALPTSRHSLQPFVHGCRICMDPMLPCRSAIECIRNWKASAFNFTP